MKRLIEVRTDLKGVKNLLKKKKHRDEDDINTAFKILEVFSDDLEKIVQQVEEESRILNKRCTALDNDLGDLLLRLEKEAPP